MPETDTQQERPRKLNRNIVGLEPMLPECGRVKIGMKGEKRLKQGRPQNSTKEEDYYQVPKKLDHFIITTMERDENGNFKRDQAMHKLLGANPKELPIRFLYNDIELNLQSGYQAYRGRTMWCRGDGVAAKRIKDIEAKKREYVWRDCPCELLEDGQCKVGSSLAFTIDGVEKVGGIYRFITTSRYSTVGLQASLSFISQLTRGRIANIPLHLVLRERTVAPDGKTTTIHVASVEYRGDTTALMNDAYQVAQITARHEARMEDIENEARQHLKDEIIDPEDADEFFPDGEAESANAPTNRVIVVKPDKSKEETSGPEPESAPEPESEQASASQSASGTETQPKPEEQPKPETQAKPAGPANGKPKIDELF